MQDLMSLSRMMNLYYHYLHSVSNGLSFSSDHELMAEFYAAVDVDYDSLVERRMGLGGSMGKSELLDIITEAHVALEQIPEGADMNAHLKYALQLEQLYRAELSLACEGASKGTENLLAAMADASEVRSYKINQRLG